VTDVHDFHSARTLVNINMASTPSVSPPREMMGTQRLGSRPRFAPVFPDLVSSDCEVQPDFMFLFFITILFFFPSITVFELLSVKDGGMKHGNLTRLQERMNRPGALMPVLGIILGIELSWMLYMHGHDLCFALADKLSSVLFPVFCNDYYRLGHFSLSRKFSY
jgi:hypothetical protein